MKQKKRHHYISKTYLRGFCDHDGKIWVCRKDKPECMLEQSPDSIGYRRYYHSQTQPDGDRDNNSIEDIFSEYEAHWPRIVERIGKKENVTDDIDQISCFIAIHRARVPASRELIENSYAQEIELMAKRLDEQGKLPSPPQGFEDIFDKLEIAIDPQVSLFSMTVVFRSVNTILNSIGLEVIHNTTSVPFLSSDNPVIWFDPTVEASALRPYQVLPGGPIEFYFPVSPETIIHGHSSLCDQFESEGIVHRGLRGGLGALESINRKIVRFAYDEVYSRDNNFQSIVQKYADTSPVLETQVIPAPNSEFVHKEVVFGKRKRRPKWKN